MKPHDLYLEAVKLGLRLETAGDKLAIMPKGKCPQEFVEMLRQHKTELLEWLARQPCPGWQAVPPLDLPLNRAIPHPSAVNRERVIRYLLRQTGCRPGPLAKWLITRENQYFEGPGRKWDCALLAYAAAMDAAMWQLKRTEREVLEFLEAAQESFQGL
jgi:hypothetical protein